MNALTNLLKKLPGLKTSADFVSAIVDLEREHAEATTAVAELEGKRETALFDGGDIGKLEDDILAADSKAKTLSIALTGAKRRRDQAAEAERQAKMETIGADAEKQTATLRKALAEFEETAAALARCAENVTVMRSNVATLNAELSKGNRADLIPRKPISQQAQSTGQLTAGQLSVDPLTNLTIWGHWPHTKRKTLTLARAG